MINCIIYSDKNLANFLHCDVGEWAFVLSEKVKSCDAFKCLFYEVNKLVS